MKMKRNLYSTGLAAIFLFLLTLIPVVAGSLTSPIGDTEVQRVGMSSSPAVMEYNGKLYCFHQGGGNNGELWYSTFDGKTWDKDIKVQDVGMSESPALINYNGVLYCFHQGGGNNGELWYSTFDGRTWGKDIHVQNVEISSSPAVIEYNGVLYCFHQGGHNDGTLWYSTFDGKTWDKDIKVQGVGMSSSPEVMEYNEKLFCFHQGHGNNGQLWYSTFDGKAWDKDIKVQNVEISSSPAVIEYNGVLYCFHQGVGNNGQLRYSTFNETIPVILPVANFSSNVTGLSVRFTDLSENATKWNWDFGDDTNSYKQNPTHTYFSKGDYTVTLEVINAYGNDTKRSVISVSPPSPQTNNSMSVSVSSEPKSVEPNKPSTITVTVIGVDGKGISGANVTLETEGKVNPTFGKTDSSGQFTSTFTASDKEGKAIIEAQVTKEGFNNASGETNVDVKESPVDPDVDDEDSFPIVPLAAILLFALVGVVIYTKRPKPAPEPKPAPPKLPVETALDVQIEPGSIPADGKSTAKVTIKLKDDKGNSIPSSDEKTVELSTTLGIITGPVKFLPGESTVSATLTSGPEAGTAKVKASSGLLKGEGKVQFTELVPVETALYVQIEPESIPADGKSTAKVTVRIRDDKGNFVPSLKERTVELSITLGTVTSQVKIPSGAREGNAVITSGEIAGTATVIASSSPLKEATAQINFVSR